MDTFSKILNDYDEDFLNNFIEQIHEEIANIESNLMLIHTATDKQERLDAVFESVQEIGVACRIGCWDPLILFMNKAEMILSGFRSGHLLMNELAIEVFLLMIDILRTTAEDMVKIRVLDSHLLNAFSRRMDEIYIADQEQKNELLNETLLQYSVRVKKDVVYNAFEDTRKNKSSQPIQSTNFETSCSLESAELTRFCNLADALEMRFPHWRGRTDTILETCLLINTSLGEIIDHRQLTTAVYLHDIGMALLPDSIVYKKGKYSSEETMLMQNHPNYAYDILSCIPDFEEAAQMVLQHHEWFNGDGYPAGLKYSGIAAGAQILSVADTFYSLTHSRPDRNYNKSIVRALSEINRNMGTQFDPDVVEAINAISRQLVSLYENKPHFTSMHHENVDNPEPSRANEYDPHFSPIHAKYGA